MAKIIERNRGEKISILVSKATIDLYKANTQKAKDLGLKLEFREDFERWFLGEQRKFTDEMARIASQNGSRA